jgi:predicted GTPase
VHLCPFFCPSLPHFSVIPCIAAIDIIVVIYDNTPDYVRQMAQLAVTMGKHCIFVRNKCDAADDDDEQGWKDFVESDKRLIAQMGISSPQVVGVSARNALLGEIEQFEWKNLMELIDEAAGMYT